METKPISSEAYSDHIIRIKEGDFKRKVSMSRLSVTVVLNSSYTLESSVKILKTQMSGLPYPAILISASLSNWGPCICIFFKAAPVIFMNSQILEPPMLG